MSKLDEKIQKIISDISKIVGSKNFENYALSFLFYRYISEDFVAWANKKSFGAEKYENMYDDDWRVNRIKNLSIAEKRYFIKPGNLFSNVLYRAPQDPELYITLKKVFKEIEKQKIFLENLHVSLESIKTKSINLGRKIQQKNKSLIKIMRAISRLNISNISFKEAYSELICRYISDGEIWQTPLEISKLLFLLANNDIEESNSSSYNIQNINTYFHKSIFNELGAEFLYTLNNVLIAGIEFEAIENISTYSSNSEKTKKSDHSQQKHLLHVPKKISSTVCLSKVLLRKGKYEQMRKHLITHNLLDAVIQLPDKLFVEFRKPVCIVVLKNKSEKDNKVLFVNASNLFIHDGSRNKLSANNVQEILEYYRGKVNIEGFAYLADHDEIKRKEYKFSVDSYIGERYKVKKLHWWNI